MAAAFDPNLEFPPGKLITGGLILVVLGFLTVGMIWQLSEMEQNAPAEAAAE